MNQSLIRVALIVDNYDKAIEFYTKKLHFDVVEDSQIHESDQRWVVICPPHSSQTSIVLVRAMNADQQKFIGNQTGGSVFLFLSTDDFWRDYHDMVDVGIEFESEPQLQPYGTVAVFKDLYGNRWDLIQYHQAPFQEE